MKSFSFHTNHRQRVKPETKIKLIPLTGTQSRSEILKKIEISSQFNMRYRGLFEYYGDDLIAYKKKILLIFSEMSFCEHSLVISPII